MNYHETLDYLYNQLPVFQHIGGRAYKEGLDNSLLLDAYFGHPHRHYKTIHVAGTNGKGSTSHLLAAILNRSGYKVGLYTSPHLIDFRERIRVDGKMIEKKYVVDFVEKHRNDFEPVHPSFFELTMMMAFKYFADEQVDIAVIEVGLGGRLDSTNIITPDLSVITNISFDHTQFLGDTLEKIAGEKAGIIKTNIPVIIGEAHGTVRDVFQQRADEVQSPIFFVEDEPQILSYTKVDENWIFETSKYPDLKCGLSGDYQLKNAETVLRCVVLLNEMDYAIPILAVYEGFEHVMELTGLSGRWQILQLNPKVICDTGHNVAGFQFIVNQLKKEKFSKLHMVIGMVSDKDISNILSLLPEDAEYYFTRASIERALDLYQLQKLAENYGLQGKIYAKVDEAIKQALKNASEKDLIFIGGSNFVVAETLPVFSII